MRPYVASLMDLLHSLAALVCTREQSFRAAEKAAHRVAA
jgi:hypothetical protein